MFWFPLPRGYLMLLISIATIATIRRSYDLIVLAQPYSCLKYQIRSEPKEATWLSLVDILCLGKVSVIR